ncbi:MAG TPA: LamG-like jellyroll fold domain-containing protein, partial [Verrucomicrobiae bacterium]|nr:LamG-like jellyroll fold domain-containing protein [Verrucomicrobiae bacterium]
DGTTQSQICINNGQQVLDVSVGVRINDPNLDDLVLHLTSPQGTSVLLFEDRGGLAATSLGLGDTLTNTIYTVFTDDTNQTTTPIKFATNFAFSNAITTNTIISTNGFDTIPAGTYTNDQAVGNWTVETNQVGIMDEPTIAHSPSNYLALTTGGITNTFATVPGDAYELIYWARGPGIVDWWTGDDNGYDIVGNNDVDVKNMTNDVGEVGDAFTFNGVNSISFGPYAGNFGTNDFSVDFWVKSTYTNGFMALLEKRLVCDNSQSFFGFRLNTNGVVTYGQSSTGGIAVGSLVTKRGVADGVFHHVAMTRNGTLISLYIDGTFDTSTNTSAITDVSNFDYFIAGTSACVGSGGTVPFVGDLDEIDLWDRALSQAEIAAIYNAGGAGKYDATSFYPNFDVSVDGYSTNTVILTNFNGAWQLYTNSFIPTNNVTTVELSGNTLSVLFDDLQLVKLPSTNYNNYFLPEEPLTPFIGENPQGCWTLDIWDTRTDSLLTNNGTLLSWNLQMTSSSTNVHLTVLTNRQADPNVSVPAGSITYFGVDVPPTANFATNILTNVLGNTLNLLFNQTALPTGYLPGDAQLLTGVAVGSWGTNVLSTQGQPPTLVPAKRYYLGVENPGPSAANFTLEVDFDVGKNTNIYTLTNEVPVATNNVSANGPDYYSFSVPANATMLTFEIIDTTNAELDLYAREGLPVPGPFDFDYQSRITGTNDQFIVVTTNSQPVPLPDAVLNLPPTTWYLSVYNPNPTAVPYAGYTIVATYVTNVIPYSPRRTDTNELNIIALTTNSPGFIQSATPGYPTNFLYSFTVPSGNPPGVQFTVANLSGFGNVQLLAQNGTFPTPQQSYSGSFDPGINPQVVVIATNAALTNLSGTTWYLAVPNTSSNTLRYSITALIATNVVTAQPLFVNASISTAANQFTLNWQATPGQSYTVQVSTNLVTWSNVTTIVAQSGTVGFTDTAPVNAQKGRFYRLLSP